MPAIPRSLITIALVALFALPALAADVDWTDTSPQSGQVDEGRVRLEGAGTHPIVTITDPEIGGNSYAVEGTVSYQDVAGIGYLEMWSYFADGGAYFSRTLDTDGPMASMSGSSDERPFQLPFFLNGSEGPERVEVNVVLPEGGTVWVGPLDLVGFGPSAEWWNENQSAVIGATAGILAGISGAVLGILGGRRKSRRLVEAILIGGASVGAVLTVASIVALVAGQPRHVWYPLALVGVILLLVDGLLIPTMRRNYAAAELQRIRALDA